MSIHFQIVSVNAKRGRALVIQRGLDGACSSLHLRKDGKDGPYTDKWGREFNISHNTVRAINLKGKAR